MDGVYRRYSVEPECVCVCVCACVWMGVVCVVGVPWWTILKECQTSSTSLGGVDVKVRLIVIIIIIIKGSDSIGFTLWGVGNLVVGNVGEHGAG